MKFRKTLALLLASLGTSRSAPAQQMPPGHPAVFNDAFTDGYATTIRGRPVTFFTQSLGTFALPSGRLVACDPFYCEGEWGKPFAQPVPRGEFPISLAVADFGDQRRTAFARIAFSAEPVVRWEMALLEGQDASALAPDEIFGYGVDAGLGAFMDEEAWRVFVARSRDDEAYADQLMDELEKVDRPEWLLLASGPGSVAIFSSGWGDGVYATYWGYDASGSVAAVLTDFYVVEWHSAVPGR